MYIAWGIDIDIYVYDIYVYHFHSKTTPIYLLYE